MSGTEEPALVDATGRHSINPKNAAVTLPPRSYDIEQLHKGLNPTARAKLSRRDDMIADVLEAGAVGGTLKEQPRSAMPEHRFVELEHPEIGIVERTQVYVGPEEAAAGDTGGTDDDGDDDTGTENTETDPADAGTQGE